VQQLGVNTSQKRLFQKQNNKILTESEKFGSVFCLIKTPDCLKEKALADGNEKTP